MDLGMCIWHPPQISQGRITSSPTWQRRESLGLRLVVTLNALLIFDYYFYNNDLLSEENKKSNSNDNKEKKEGDNNGNEA